MSKLSENRCRIYFAGKVSKNCWRHALVPDLRSIIADAHNSPRPVDCGNFVCVGPFFVACNHGCAHGPATHGASGSGCGQDAPTREEVFQRSCTAIESANIVIAYITAYDCIGTVWEIAYAQDRGISTCLIFAPWINRQEFWFPLMRAVRLPAELTTATVDGLPAVVNSIIRLAGRRARG